MLFDKVKTDATCTNTHARTPLPRHTKVTRTCGEEAAHLPKKNERSVHNHQIYLNGFKAKSVFLASQIFASHHPQEGKQLLACLLPFIQTLIFELLLHAS